MKSYCKAGKEENGRRKWSKRRELTIEGRKQKRKIVRKKKRVDEYLPRGELIYPRVVILEPFLIADSVE
jgi:hypothetical protein